MITEPEMAGEPEQGLPVDLLSDKDGKAASAGAGRRPPWRWALGGVLAASAVWAALLHATAYGHTAAPDVHGLHFSDTPCTSFDLEPLTDSVTSAGFSVNAPSIRRGPALDHVSCTTTSSRPVGDGWATEYLVTVTVDLHKKSDPRAEFKDTYDPVVSSPTMVEADGSVFFPGLDAVPTLYPGLGDLAYLAGGRSHQSLAVLYGGAVLSVSVDATGVWAGGGSSVAADGTFKSDHPVGISSLRPLLPRTLRHLMSVLSQ